MLQGESGLGKSMFLRDLVRRAPQIVVFLPATRCAQGVLEAIQGKLEGPARDPEYLRKLIYAGAIDIAIDGLNEVSADTRARVVQFAESNFKGNLIIATQPMEWSAPPLARTFVLLPLADQQIEAFLSSRQTVLPDDVEVTSEDYRDRCRQFLKGALSDALPEPTREANRRVLSNPMDLSLVAQMLARGQIPDLFQLQEQHYRVMAEDYKQRNQDHEFPLKAFAARVYDMRCTDETAFASGEFPNELAAMARHKMVIPRHTAEQEADAAPRWTFRHDKVMDYFLVQAFLGPGNERPTNASRRSAISRHLFAACQSAAVRGGGKAA